jgi:hypothetical protein
MIKTLCFSLVLLVASVSSLTPNESSCVSEYLHTHAFRGSVEHPNSAEYEDTLAIDNKRVVVSPALVLVPSSEHDVSVAISATRSCALSFSIISGGHSAAGYCLSQDGVTLNIRDGLNGVELLADNSVGGTVRVESGALWKNMCNQYYRVPSCGRRLHDSGVWVPSRRGLELLVEVIWPGQR